MEKIKNIIDSNEIVLFMKGTQEMPKCGFSSIVVKILEILKVPFYVVDVLEDEKIRQDIKVYSNWPTIPQLYVKKNFIGGADIVQEMYKNGDLQKLLKDL